jgi:DNA modification methylase
MFNRSTKEKIKIKKSKYKSNILKYKKDYNGYHPTQKPILLLEDLIKTFSNENDLVVDLTMGSGSTGVACNNTNRDFIGIEMSEQYFNIAQKRINGTEFKPNGFEKNWLLSNVLQLHVCCVKVQKYLSV